MSLHASSIQRLTDGDCDGQGGQRPQAVRGRVPVRRHASVRGRALDRGHVSVRGHVAMRVLWMLLFGVGLFVFSLLVGGGRMGIVDSAEALWQSLQNTVATTNQPPAEGDSSPGAEGLFPGAGAGAGARLPRGVVGVLVGAALGVAGCLLQNVTRNPLADTGLLGVNAGASLGVVLGIHFVGIQSGHGYLFSAFGGAAVGTGLVLLFTHLRPSNTSALDLILGGMAIGATCFGIAAMVLLASQQSYDAYRFWLLGSLAGSDFSMLGSVLPAMAAGLVMALLAVKPLEALLLGDDVAQGLGHRPTWVRIWATVAVTLLTGAAVALAGPIAFLGLLAPHVARHWTGSKLTPQLLLSAWVGGCVLLAADTLARVVNKPYETPVSVVLTLVGAPWLMWVVASKRSLSLSGKSAGGWQ